MMRTFTAWLCLCMYLPLRAQDKLPSFGKIDKADLEMTTCDFDPDAECYWLMDIGEVQYNLTTGGSYIQTDRRCRIKILKEKGIHVADVKIPYFSRNHYEEISNIDGYVYNLDEAGKVVATRLESKLIFDKKVTDRYSQISFALPGVKVGSVIEYRYRSHKKSIEDIDDWYFQKEEPVRYSAYNLLIPEFFDFNYKITRRQDIEIKKGGNNDGNWFIMRNIPGLKEEPYTAGLKDYIQRIDFQLSSIHPPGGQQVLLKTTWEKLNEELLDSDAFGGQLGRHVPGMEELKSRLKTMTSEKEKIQTIYRFVQKNMEWNGHYGLYSTDGIKQAWDKKSGSKTDINLLLVNLLKDADLQAYPLLVSTKDNGKVNMLYPFLWQFNEVVGCVHTRDDAFFVLDAADKYNPYTLVPYDLQQTQGMLVNRKEPGFVNLGDRSQLRHNIILQLHVQEDGKVEGEATVNSYEYGKNIRMNTYRKGKLKETFSTNDGITLAPDSIAVQYADADSLPLEQHLWLKGALQPSGEYAFVPYNLFTGMSKNPFTAERRQTDIDFNFPQHYTIAGSVLIPENYTFDDLPRNMRMIMPDTSIVLTRILQKDGNGMLSFRITLDFKRPVYEVDEYPDVKEFYKKLYAALDEKIVLKKKV